MSFIMFIAVGVVGWILYTQYLKKLLAQGKAGHIKLGLIALGLIFLILAATGRAHALFAILGAALTQIMRIAPLLVRFAPFLKRFLGGAVSAAAGNAQAQKSKVATDTIVMSLDHSTGSVTGQVIAGDLAGRMLDTLSLVELQSLYAYCNSHDPEAARLLQTYISRERYEEWQSAGPGAGGERSTGAMDQTSTMSVAEAKEVLGLTGDVTKQSITAAHRTLMGRFHPDKGGNDYIATKINTARSVLLDQLK